MFVREKSIHNHVHMHTYTHGRQRVVCMFFFRKLFILKYVKHLTAAITMSVIRFFQNWKGDFRVRIQLCVICTASKFFACFFFSAPCCCIDFILFFFANDFNLSAIKTSYLFATLYRRSFAYYWSIYAFHGAQIEHISIFSSCWTRSSDVCALIWHIFRLNRNVNNSFRAYTVC